MPPRSTILTIVLLITVVVILLLRSFSETLNGFSSYYRDAFGPSRSLRTWLADEALYAVAIQERLEIIKRWRPRDDARIGTWVCGLDRVAKQDKCVIYSFGINDESSFESTLLKRAPGCEVWGYDYSVNSWGPEITSDPALRDRAHFKSFALGGTNNHGDNDNPKFWIARLAHGAQRCVCAGDLRSATKSAADDRQPSGHTFIDILKIDIEGGEFDALTTFLSARAGDGKVLPVGQLQLEIHAREGRENFEYFAHW
ncbi:hypothetical protein H4582DRAFT_292822 [Lactarius indigo]|nr:hypothetical protein H4582DRAFT_292822 [Lactarius indigo]